MHCILGACVDEGIFELMLGNSIGKGFVALYVMRLCS